MKKIAPVIAVTFFVVACGGGGGGGSKSSAAASAPPPPPPLPAGTVALSDSAYSVSQSSGLLTVTVNRADGSRDGAVSYATSDGTATAGAEYTSRSGTLSWASGDADAKTISLPINTTASNAAGKTFKITLSDPTNGITLGTPTSATITINATAPATHSVSVRGNRLIDGSGNVLQLRGASFTGFEYVAMLGYSPGDPSGGQAGQPNGPRWSALQKWHANTIRFTLNEASWLGYSCVDSEGITHDPDPGKNYRSAIQTQVQQATDAGLYAIVSLQWAAPGKTCPMIQTQMPDADHSVDFWTSIATTFKSNPAVMFSLYNEPFIYLAAQQDQWNMLMTGGTLSYYPTSSTNSKYVEVQTPWKVASMQTLIDTVRATGATNVILISGLDFDNNMDGWLANKPRDSLNQLAAEWHPYPPQQAPGTVTVATGGTGYAVNDTITLATSNTVYAPAVLKVTSIGAGGVVTGVSITTGGNYLETSLPTAAVGQSSTSGAGTGATFMLSAWRNITNVWSVPSNWPTVQAISAQVPVVLSEIGEHNAPGTVGSPFLQQLLPFAGANNWSVIGCCWDVFSNADNVLIKDADGTPTDGYGKVFFDWMTGAAWQ